MRVKCFYIKPNGKASRWLRRYKTVDGSPCPLTGGYHNAQVPIEDSLDAENKSDEPAIREMYADQWPKQCDCGYQFAEEDTKQIFSRNQYEDDKGNVMTLDSAPAGAMWDATWFHGHKSYTGPDGMSLVVKTPGGEWMVDGRASNCTKPDDDEHKCWVRKGVPPNITVSKDGNTCAAGAGSILIHGYHAMLQEGELREC